MGGENAEDPPARDLTLYPGHGQGQTGGTLGSPEIEGPCSELDYGLIIVFGSQHILTLPVSFHLAIFHNAQAPMNPGFSFFLKSPHLLFFQRKCHMEAGT